METASGIIENIGLAVRAMSVVTLLAGILVLAGAMASAIARVYDAVVMKVLGATRLRVLTAFMLEYMLMGAGAALIAALAGGGVLGAGGGRDGSGMGFSARHFGNNSCRCHGVDDCAGAYRHLFGLACAQRTGFADRIGLEIDTLKADIRFNGF